MKDYKALSDLQLLELLKASDQYAYTEIYQRHWAKLYFYARKILHDISLAEDTVQEVLFYLWHKRDTLQINNAMASYLYSSVRYTALNTIKRKNLQDRYLDSLTEFIGKGECTTDGPIREKQLEQKIESAISGLPLKMRTVFELSRTSQLSHKSIAKKLNIKERTVKNQVTNAIRILRLKFSK